MSVQDSLRACSQHKEDLFAPQKAEIRDKDGRQRKREKRSGTRERREKGQWRGIKDCCHRGTRQRIASG